MFILRQSNGRLFMFVNFGSPCVKWLEIVRLDGWKKGLTSECTYYPGEVARSVQYIYIHSPSLVPNAVRIQFHWNIFNWSLLFLRYNSLIHFYLAHYYCWFWISYFIIYVCWMIQFNDIRNTQITLCKHLLVLYTTPGHESLQNTRVTSENNLFSKHRWAVPTTF